MIYERRYVQFNDLVIDGYDMIEQSDSDISFKYISHNRSFGHGTYAPFKRNYVFANEGNVALTLKLYMDKLPYNKQPVYRNFVVSELSKPGKLWAVQNGELIWAYAVITNKGEQNSYNKNLLVVTVDFTLPEGIWHKADMQKTFLQDYNVCDFMDCYDFKEYQPCKSEDCCGSCAELHDAGCDCCICSSLCREMALCLNLERIKTVFDVCDKGVDFHIVYNCIKGQEYFGDDYLGQKFCTGDSCSGIISGNFYGNTDIPTTSYKIILHGKMLNPEITINDNTNIINGDYDGVLTINSNGEVYYRASDCCEDSLVDVRSWIIPNGMEYGWTINPGNNRFIANVNQCCGVTCAYIDIDNLTL